MRLTLSLLCAFTLTAAVPLNAQSADQLFSSAVDAQQRGDFPTAIRDYQKLLQTHPNMGEARANLGAALAHTGQYDQAIAQYKLALPIAPDKDGVRLNLGLAYYKKGVAETEQAQGQKNPQALADLSQAVEQFQQLRKLRPDGSSTNDTQIAILIAYAELPAGRGPDAVATLLPLEAANAANPEFEYVLGEAQIASGSPREGAARLSKLADATQSPDAYYLAGTTYLDLNDITLARTNLEAALKLNPQLTRIYTLVGMARDKSGDQAAAEPAFREAVKQNPDDFEANLYLGAILYKRRATDEAKPFLDKALQLHPNDAMARYENAMWDSNAKKYEEAAKLLESVEQSDPNWLDPHVELATVYYRLHRPEDGARERAIVDKLTVQQQTKGPGVP
jgi:tetratricopeptide (TPR) repeat protein